MSLQAELDAFMANVRTQVPASVLAPIEHFYGQTLHDPARFPNVPKVGDPVADFTLPDAYGQPVQLSALLAQGPVIVSFYRGAWCPFCNIELRALQQALPEFERLGATLLAISPEKPDYALPMVEKEGLHFPVLTDSGNTVARQFGLVFALEGEIRDISLNVFGVDLPKLNGNASWEIPVPATFVIGKDGRIAYTFFDPEFRHRVEPEVIVASLKKLA